MTLKRYDQVSCLCDYPSDNLEETPDGDFCYYEDAIKEIHNLVFKNETLKRQLREVAELLYHCDKNKLFAERYKTASEIQEMLEIFSENNNDT